MKFEFVGNQLGISPLVYRNANDVRLKIDFFFWCIKVTLIFVLHLATIVGSE